jgi:hypothetical protein
MSATDEDGHIPEDRLVEISQQTENCSEEELAHLTGCLHCATLLTAFSGVKRT